MQETAQEKQRFYYDKHDFRKASHSRYESFDNPYHQAAHKNPRFSTKGDEWPVFFQSIDRWYFLRLIAANKLRMCRIN